MEIGVQFPDKDNFSKSKKTFIKTESSSEKNKFGGEKISRKKDENARGIDNQTNISAISRLRFAVCHHTGDRSFSDQQFFGVNTRLHQNTISKIGVNNFRRGRTSSKTKRKSNWK